MSLGAKDEAKLNSEVLSTERYERALPAIMAVPSKEVKQFSVDVHAAVIALMGSLPRLRELWPEVVRELPLSDPALMDKLEDYAVAASVARTAMCVTVPESDGLPELYEQADATRGILRSEIDALIRRNLVKSDAIRGYSGQSGYKIVAYDLQTLTTVLRRHWPAIQGRCAATRSEIDEADVLATRMLVLASEREHAPKTMSPEAQIYARAMTLLVSCYDQVRCGIHYLRWKEGDADEIAPSLYGGRKRTLPSHPLPQ